eukprot:6385722-Pyramimonas_sp.AAC.1
MRAYVVVGAGAGVGHQDEEVGELHEGLEVEAEPPPSPGQLPAGLVVKHKQCARLRLPLARLHPRHRRQVLQLLRACGKFALSNTNKS